MLIARAELQTCRSYGANISNGAGAAAEWLYIMEAVSEIKAMWEEWKTIPFPADYSGKDVAGICVTSLDSYAAGCIDTFISRKGRLDDWRISVLEDCRKKT
jgi:hypothetical protein